MTRFVVLRSAIDGFVRHRSSMLASGLSFRTLLSIAPLLVVAQALLSIWVGAARGRSAILAAIGTAMGRRAEDLVASWLDAARDFSGAATTIGVVLFLVGATRLVLALDDALDLIFEVPSKPTRFGPSIVGWLKMQVKALGITLGLAIMIGVGIGLEVLVAGALEPSGGIVAAALVPFTEWLVASILLVGFLTLIYAVLPSLHMSIRDVLVGAVVSAAALELGMAILWLYFSFVEVGASYGAAGAVLLVLAWLYYSAWALMFGAEIAAAARRAHRERRQRSGARPRRTSSSSSAPLGGATSET